jgi:hypothetical protein
MTKTKIFASAVLSSLFIGFIVSGCTDSNAWKKIDVSKEQVNYTVQRFDQDFFAIDTLHIAESEAKLRAKYGQFYNDYVTHIMNFGRSESPVDTVHHDPHIDIINFLGNRSDRDLYDTVQKEYSNIADIQAGMTDLLKHFQYYFPKKPHITRVYTFITEFSDGIATYDDSTICIGLDMYLGSTYRYYSSVDLPQFMIAKLKRPYIIPNITEALYNANFDKTAYNAQLPLIEALINEGKKYYFMECMLPDAPDSLIMGYTMTQEEWCRSSESSIWKYLNEQDLLYKVNYMEQKRYTADGPSTTGMPPESPPKVGSWVGWQIVRKFMKNSGGKVTLNDLLDNYSAKQIFALSNYKPK